MKGATASIGVPTRNIGYLTCFCISATELLRFRQSGADARPADRDIRARRRIDNQRSLCSCAGNCAPGVSRPASESHRSSTVTCPGRQHIPHASCSCRRSALRRLLALRPSLPHSGNHALIRYGKSSGPRGRELVPAARPLRAFLASGSIAARRELPPIPPGSLKR